MTAIEKPSSPSHPLRIGVASGTRAEFGLLLPLLRALFQDQRFAPRLYVTGAHLSPSHGLTVREIEAAGFPIAARIEAQLASDSSVGAAKSTGLAVLGFADAFGDRTLDGLIVLGDRYEIWAAVVAATLLGIPVIHINGGEVTEGAFDESIRHAITKCSALHFVARESYRRRVIQMGEAPERVVLTGALHLDTVADLSPWTWAELEARTNLPRGAKNLLVTFHPETRGLIAPETVVAELLAGLDRHKDAHVLFTLPNADPSSSLISAAVQRYCAEQPQRAAWVASLGQQGYLSAVALADVVVGNSSSGLTEAPVLGTATVNIGDRQKGREMPASVINVPAGDGIALAMAISKACSASFRDVVARVCAEERAVVGRVAQEMVRALIDRQAVWTARKGFYDLRTHDLP